jgi:hypothetical protein
MGKNMGLEEAYIGEGLVAVKDLKGTHQIRIREVSIGDSQNPIM